MSDANAGSRPGRDQYWRELIALKTEAIYWRLYRDDRAGWVSRVGSLRAIASSGSIGAWVIWREYALIWAGIIAASQVADALRDIFPFARQYQHANEHMLALDRILIDAELDWIKVFRGNYPEDDVLERCKQFRMLKLEAERRDFQEGAPRRNERLWAVAEQEARRYLSETYTTESADD